MGLMDKAKHAAEELQGKTKQKAGEATDDKSLQAEGQADQGKASAKKVGDNVKDAFDN
ncbi:CsbD family protein [Allobranchiibius sp. CTAmp26]|uniref:CsbD family protein n=1 Tax=Allobranchiibius sp. CTAmp26 TaxID=2815214 RepID=UPI001AA0BA9A|nr:CsbD family protein [Allobranchiibius sp. CTAmp26]MBO1755016.1 CsbD family protein [Allobranchiibius sp. CTAmp26]